MRNALAVHSGYYSNSFLGVSVEDGLKRGDTEAGFLLANTYEQPMGDGRAHISVVRRDGVHCA